MQINITVRNQSIIDICPCVVLAEDSQNYVTAVFTFLTDDWENTEKTAQFQNPKTGEVYESILDSSNACTVRWEALSDSGDMNVAVFGVNGGYRITTNMGVITVLPTLSGGESDTPPSPDVYQQLLTMLGQKADNITYSDSVLRLLSGSKELARVIIAGGGSSVQPDWNQNDSGAADYIKNRPFYDDTNVLLEWDGNTEGLVAATTTEEVGGIPAGTAVAYKIAEYADSDTFDGAMARLSNGEISTTVIRSIPYYFDIISAVDAEASTYNVVDRSVTYQGINYPEPGIYAHSYTIPTETNYIAQLYVDAPVKLPNKYLNLDTALNEKSENPVQNKIVAEKFTEVTNNIPYIVKTNSYEHILEVTDEELWDMLNSNIPLLGMFTTLNNCVYLPEIVAENGEKKLYFWPTYINPNSPNNKGRMVKNGRLESPDVDQYTRLIPLPINEEKGKVLTVGTGKNGEGIYSWESLPPVAADDLFIVSISLSQSITFSASYDDITSAISAGKVVIGVVNDGKSASIKLASSYWDTREERVYFYSIDGFDGWKSVYVGASSRGYDATRYQSDVPTLTVDDLEANAGCVIVVSSTGGSYQLKKLTAEDVNALAKDNTTEYTPTGDYNPATKKYVDDAVSGVSAATPRQQMQNTDTTVTLQPGILYVFPEMATLAVTLAAPTNTAIANEYIFTFTSGSTATTLSIPDSVITDIAVEPNTYYECSIIDNHMVFHEWEVTT